LCLLQKGVMCLKKLDDSLGYLQKKLTFHKIKKYCGTDSRTPKLLVLNLFSPRQPHFVGQLTIDFSSSERPNGILIRFVTISPCKLSVNNGTFDHLKLLEFTKCLVQFKIFHVRSYHMRSTLRISHMWR
jgi:hypothetical protein